MQFVLDNEQATEVLAANIASIIKAPAVIYLQGDLGARKTTFVRALLQAQGFVGRVKSPTYAIVEPYQIDGVAYYHFDLYRLTSPLELETIGIGDYFDANSICFIEWPDKGEGVLPKPDLLISLQHDLQTTEVSRRICTINAHNVGMQQKIANLDTITS